MSSTLSPARISTASASSSPTICSVVPMIAKSPLAQVACWRCLIAAKSGAAALLGARTARVSMLVSLKASQVLRLRYNVSGEASQVLRLEQGALSATLYLRRRTCDALSETLSQTSAPRADVLVQPEQVFRVVLALHPDQAVVVRAVGVLDALAFV